MMARATALQVYGNLPKTNCGRCGERTCMDYALKLVEGEAKPADCPVLTDEQRLSIEELLSPAVRKVRIGIEGKHIDVGGEEVMYRHELRFFNQTALFIDVSDLMEESVIERRVSFVKDFEFERVGVKLCLDGIALRSASGDAEKFGELVKKVADMYEGPLVLCSLDPVVLEAGAKIVRNRRPLLYAATEANWNDVLRIAREYKAPLAVCSQEPSRKELGEHPEGIILDPCPDLTQEGIADSLDRFTMHRKNAVEGVSGYDQPLMASTVAPGGDPYTESMLACILTCRFASLLILHSIEPAFLLPILTLKQGLYSDPRAEPVVDAKLYEIGTPDKDSPVVLTTNFALTYFSVSKDLEDAKVSCFLLVVDTEGLAVTVAMAAEKLTGAAVKDALTTSCVKEKVAHKKLIIPGVAARLKDGIEEATGWEVLVGPQDSSQIASYLGEKFR